jgi:cystinosin
MGWVFYAAYLSSMYFDNEIKTMYQERFKNESSVQSNDVAFAGHAAILSFVYLWQIFYYRPKKSKLKLKPQTWVLVLGMGVPSLGIPLLIIMGVLDYTWWLDYFYMLSFFKIGCTLTKYSKQVWFNYNRQSTAGWNIWYNFLEFSGGFLSMLQIIFDSYDMSDITGITGNIAKFALGIATLFFDGIFFTQHYVLYPGSSDDEEDKKGVPKHVRAKSRFELPVDINHYHQHDLPLMIGTTKTLIQHSVSRLGSLDTTER